MSANLALVTKDGEFKEAMSSLMASQSIQMSAFNPEAFDFVHLVQNKPNVVLVEISALDSSRDLDIIQRMRCREHLRRIPVIAILESADQRTVLAVHQAGVRDILAKSSSNESLMERIQKFCGKVRPSKPSLMADALDIQAPAGGVEWSDPATTAFKKHVQREVSRSLERLPSLPLVVMEVMQLVESDSSSAGDFEEHISHDQALAARILRIANSSFFAQTRKISSIRDAIVILGLRTLKSVVLAATTHKLFSTQETGYGYQPGGLWKHSIACAVGSRLVAQRAEYNMHEAEEFFVHGLLHDIGKLLLNRFAAEKAEEFQEAFRHHQTNICESERLIFGTDHTKVGVRIADRWNLPPQVVECIRYHHYPSRAKEHQKRVALVHAVNYMCHQMKVGMVPEQHIPEKLDIETITQQGLSQEFLDESREEFVSQLNEMEKLFSMIVD
jgi:putative nucleotidyltransferase with HDIG domain